MKALILTTALAAGLAAAVPANANAGDVGFGLSASDGHVSVHVVAGGPHYRGHGPRRYGPGRFGRCLNWNQARRHMDRRFNRIRFERRVFNRRGQRVFIAHARNYRGAPVRVRYNACTHRVTNVVRLWPGRGHHGPRGWRH